MKQIIGGKGKKIVYVLNNRHYLYLTLARDLGRVYCHALYTVCLPCACTQPSFFVQANLTESFLNVVCAIQVFAMGTRKSSRRNKPPIKFTDYEMDNLQEDSATPQQISEAVKHELSQVESTIRDLTPMNSKAEQPTVKQDRTIEDLHNQNLQLN